MRITKKMKLELKEKGLRYCSCCDKVKEIDLFYSKKVNHSDFTRCTRCRSYLNKKELLDKEDKTLNEKRNTEWFKNYLEKKNGKLKSTKNKFSYYKKMAWQSYYTTR
jgi:hypothetical protein